MGSRVAMGQHTLGSGSELGGERVWRAGPFFKHIQNIHDFYSRLHLSEKIFNNLNFLVPGQSFLSLLINVGILIKFGKIRFNNKYLLKNVIFSNKKMTLCDLQ